MTKEKEINETNEVKEGMELQVNDVNNLTLGRKSEVKTFTTIEDVKTIFNLQNECDEKLNDCVGEKLRIKDVLIKVIERDLEEPEVDSETGEVIRDKEYSKICILIDEAGKSYVTASKMFTNRMIQMIEMFGIPKIKEGIEIEITKVSVKNSPNKALSFDII